MAGHFTLSLVRHAKTKGNEERRYVGWTDEEIIESAFPTISVEQQVVYGSDLKRCRQTATYYYPNAEYIAVPELRESNFGDYEMTTYEDLKNNSHYRQWIDHPEYVSPPNGENLSVFKKRVWQGLQRVTKEQNAHLVVHGGSIRAILVQLAPERSQFWDWQIGHNERYILAFETYEHFKEGRRCTSLSVEPITESDNT